MSTHRKASHVVDNMRPLCRHRLHEGRRCSFVPGVVLGACEGGGCGADMRLAAFVSLRFGALWPHGLATGRGVCAFVFVGLSMVIRLAGQLVGAPKFAPLLLVKAQPQCGGWPHLPPRPTT